MVLTRSRKMTINYNDVPLGIRIINKLAEKCCPRARCDKRLIYKTSVLFLTYLAYTCYHLSRKPISVVKSVLHRNCSDIRLPSTVENYHSKIIADNDSTWCDYPPFDGPDATALFGTLDSAFLFCYAAAMFGSGFVAERVSLRYFLSMGMILSGIFTYLFGIAKTSNIHSLWYFIIVQGFAGIFQTTGWPGVVTVVGRWFGKSKRGLIFGIWNSHTSIGNILGSLIAAYYVEKDWSMSFIVPGLIIGSVGFLLFLFLADSPELVGCQERSTSAHRTDSNAALEEEGESSNRYADDVDNITSVASINSEVSYRPTERTPILERSTTSSSTVHSSSHSQSPISLLGALRIPGVLEFSLCLFFSKLVNYTFLYWLPLYIQSSTTLGATGSAKLSTLFDVGGILGAIAAGTISDYSGMPATTCSTMLLLASPTLLLYQQYGALSLSISVATLFIAGILVNGPYALITTSVSAELGQHSSLEGNSKALATVTAIIDGTGSIGAAIGPLLAGVISTTGWQNVFYMLIISNIIAMLLLIRLVVKESPKLKRILRIRTSVANSPLKFI